MLLLSLGILIGILLSILAVIAGQKKEDIKRKIMPSKMAQICSTTNAVEKVINEITNDTTIG